MDAPIIGLIKRDLDNSPVRITPFLHDVKALADAGADIIAFDATDRVRPATVGALAAGADFVGTTMSGYTGGPEPVDPDIDLLPELRELTPFVIAEGRIRTTEQAQAAARADATCVVIGGALASPRASWNGSTPRWQFSIPQRYLNYMRQPWDQRQGLSG